jgi:uncharacterized RDD family membrane protein YckC
VTEVGERAGAPPARSTRKRPRPPLARWWERAVALLVDTLILTVVYLVCAVSISAAFSAVEARTYDDVVTSVTTTGDVALIAAAIVLPLLYFGLCTGLAPGQTLGGRMLHIAVRDAANGKPIGYRRGLLRSLIHLGLYACLVVPGLASDLRVFRDAKGQTIADRVVGSLTVRTRRRR